MRAHEEDRVGRRLARRAVEGYGEQLGIVPDSLRNWVQQARIDAGAKPGLTGLPKITGA